MMEMVYTACGIAIGAAGILVHKHLVKKQQARISKEYEGLLDKEYQRTRDAEQKATYLADRVRNHELERAQSEAFADGYLMGQQEANNYRGLQQVGHGVENGKASTVLIRKGRQQHAGSI